MKSTLTEIVFLLDRSGSMAGLESDTIGGFNAFVEKQCQLDGETIVTTVLFDDQYEVLWNGIDGNKVKLTKNEYFVRGYTALLDAIGKSILDVDRRLENTSKNKKPDNIIFVITTDGMENASREFSYETVKELIELKKNKHDWEFIFMGANIDTTKEAGKIGISEEQAYHFEASKTGVHKMYDTINEEIIAKRR